MVRTSLFPWSKRSLGIALSVVLVVALVAVNRCGAPPVAPKVESATAQRVLAAFFHTLKTGEVPAWAGLLPAQLDAGDCLLLHYGRRYWFAARGRPLSRALRDLLSRVARVRDQLATNVPPEVYLAFPGPRTAIPLPNSFLWNITLVSGVDGVWLEDQHGFSCLLPQQAARYPGGRVFSFLPLRFGLDRGAILNRLRSMPRVEQTGWGRRRAVRRHPRQSYQVLRFRAAAFYARMDPEDTLRVWPLYRGVPLGQTTPTAATVRQRTILAGRWFVRHLARDGRFSYRYDPFHNRSNRYRYSYPRHAGTLFAMYRIAALTNDKEMITVADRGLVWLLAQVRRATKGRYISEQGQGKLGTTALTALALFARRQACGEEKYDDLLQGLLDFICFMQLPDGRLCSYYRPGKAPAYRPVAQNFPGQALWALAKGERLFGKYAQAYRKGMAHQTRSAWSFFLSEFYVFPFSWEMQAIGEAFSFHRSQAGRDFLYRAADSMLDFQYGRDAPFPDYRGGFGAPEWFVPLAHAAGFQGEGLTAAYGYAKRTGDRKRAARYRKALLDLARFLLDQQVTRAASYFYANPDKAVGAFRAGPADHRQQIDYTQHSLAALLNMLEEGVFHGP